MATQNAPFWDVDVTRFMADFKFPTPQFDTLLTAQRRNVEAVAAANQLALEGVQAVMRRQLDIVRQSVEELTSMTTELMTAGTPEARVAKQAELTKASFEKAIANVRELSEMVAKSNGEAADVINKRITELLDEVKAAAAKR